MPAMDDVSVSAVANCPFGVHTQVASDAGPGSVKRLKTLLSLPFYGQKSAWHLLSDVVWWLKYAWDMS